MLPCTNLLFLLSLGIMTWIILCYFQQIEDRLKHNQIHNNDIDTCTTETELLEDLNNDDKFYNNNKCEEKTNLYTNFVCIFICIYILIKMTILTERYVIKNSQNDGCYVTIDDICSDTLLYSDMASNDFDDNSFEEHLMVLNKIENFDNEQAMTVFFNSVADEDEYLIKTIEQCHEHCNDMYNNQIFINEITSKNQKNFIPESNFDLNSQFNKCAITTKVINLNNIWSTYFEMQKTRLIKSPIVRKSPLQQLYQPIVLSAQQLQNLPGFF